MLNPTFTKFITHLQPKYIGITIADQKLRAIEATHGTILSEDIPDSLDTLLPTSIWKNSAALKKLIHQVFKAAGVQIWSYRPVVIFSVPPNTPQDDNKAIYNCLMLAGAKSAYLLDDLILAALGSGVYQKEEGPVYHKKIYLLVQKNASYLGAILAGGTFGVKTIPKGYDSLTIDDLKSEFTDWKNQFPREIPAQFQHRSVAKDVAQNLKKAWENEFSRKIYISAPARFKDYWGNHVDDFQLIYTSDGEQALSKGMEEFFPVLMTKKSPTGRKPLSPVQLYLLLFALIAVIMMFIFKR